MYQAATLQLVSAAQRQLRNNRLIMPVQERFRHSDTVSYYDGAVTCNKKEIRELSAGRGD